MAISLSKPLCGTDNPCLRVERQEPDPTPQNLKIAINVQTEHEAESVTMSRNGSRKDVMI